MGLLLPVLCLSARFASWLSRVVARVTFRGGRSDAGDIHEPSTWLIENTLEQLSDGRLIMLFRSGTGYMWKSISNDRGKMAIGAAGDPTARRV